MVGGEGQVEAVVYNVDKYITVLFGFAGACTVGIAEYYGYFLDMLGRVCDVEVAAQIAYSELVKVRGEISQPVLV